MKVQQRGEGAGGYEAVLGERAGVEKHRVEVPAKIPF